MGAYAVCAKCGYEHRVEDEREFATAQNVHLMFRGSSHVMVLEYKGIGGMR